MSIDEKARETVIEMCKTAPFAKHVDEYTITYIARCAINAYAHEAAKSDEQPDDCRAAFEENTIRLCVAGKYDAGKELFKKPNGNYAIERVQAAWMAWQDCWALRHNKREVVLVDDLIKIMDALIDCRSTMNICATDGNSNVKEENEQVDNALLLLETMIKRIEVGQADE